MSKVSIAMATYNGAEYIEEQLGSLLEQTRPADEVVIVDDKSTDHTAELVRRFIDKNRLEQWHFFLNETNVGYKLNFSHALSRTTGDIVFLCDQDDYWHPDKLEVMTRLMEEAPEILSLNSSFQMVDSRRRPKPAESIAGRSNNNIIFADIAEGALVKFSAEDVLLSNISPGCTMAVRKELKESFIATSAHKLPHDFEMNILAALDDGLYYYNKKLIDYRLHEANTIGLAGENNGLSFAGTMDSRKMVLRECVSLCEYHQTAVVYPRLTDRQKEYVGHFRRYIQARQRCLSGFHLGSWMVQWGMLPFMKPYKKRFARWNIGDFVFMCKGLGKPKEEKKYG